MPPIRFHWARTGSARPTQNPCAAFAQGCTSWQRGSTISVSGNFRHLFPYQYWAIHVGKTSLRSLTSIAQDASMSTTGKRTRAGVAAYIGVAP